jgi:hypothetical protein
MAMAIRNNNRKITNKFIDKFHSNSPNVVTPVVSTVVSPVVEVGKDRVEVYIEMQGNETLYTTPTDRDFILTYASLSYYVQGAGGGAEKQYIQFTPEGSSAQSFTSSAIDGTDKLHYSEDIYFERGLKLARGSDIDVAFESTAGYARIAGFIVDKFAGSD